mmetsp:Transcript_85899/g.243617  ORF Transcript_85899/g.243617 Transcript_85899/m.243617 type:complete len:403 (-) Transcript_85899:95-1303(-)
MKVGGHGKKSAISTYTERVDIGGSELENVSVDLEKGPRVKQADGTWTSFDWRVNQAPSPVGPSDRKEYKKEWFQLTRSEQDIMLTIVARKNRAMRELIESPGYKMPELPDFLASFKPNQAPWQTMPRDQQAIWWQKMSKPPAQGFDMPEDQMPVLCLWYSGGMDTTQGRDQLANLVDAAMDAGLKHVLVMDYPDTYGIVGEGSKPWASYVDRLVQEIDKDPDRRGRQLILLGHSRGATPAMSVATRLGGRRVLKVYCVSSGAPIEGQKSPFQLLSEGFKASTDLDLLKWFCSLNPVPILLRMMQAVESGDMTIEDSTFLKEKVDLMKRQYVNAIWPDMSKDLRIVNVPIMVVAGTKDYNETPEAMHRWKNWSTKEVTVKFIEAGHMDTVDHTDIFISDMVGL